MIHGRKDAGIKAQDKIENRTAVVKEMDTWYGKIECVPDGRPT